MDAMTNPTTTASDDAAAIRFPDMPYARPDLDATFSELQQILDEAEQAGSGDELIAGMRRFERVKSGLTTQATLASVRHSIDTRDEFYEHENDAFDEGMPRFDELFTRLARIVIGSPHRQAVVDAFGPHLIEKYEVLQRTFTPEILDDLVEENKLASEYQKLMASAEIQFEGEVRNLSGLVPFQESADRDMRRRASAAAWGWLAEHQVQLDELYDNLVQVRDRIGRKLGYESFVPVAYARMGRTDWDQADAQAYRRQILDHVVPLAQKIYRQQAERIGIPDLKFYDVPLVFTSGNPTPQGGEQYLVDHAEQMYRELSPETDEFFGMMIDQQLMDLSNKPGKAPGGYMTFFADYKVPFIFSNFNGTSGDVDVLTHEAGHAFQGWLHRDTPLEDLSECTAEVAEIHSMAMEFFTHPWMQGFFGPDTEKYRYAHVVDALNFLPYAASIDEFQEWVYEHPQATPTERRATYRDIERRYLPHIDYDGNEFLEAGGRWQKQLHTYLYPFYYLDYALSQVVALQYFAWDTEDHDAAWNSYLTLCRRSGLVPFKALVPESGLSSPFDDGTIAALAPKLEAYLDGLDHSQLV